MREIKTNLILMAMAATMLAVSPIHAEQTTFPSYAAFKGGLNIHNILECQAQIKKQCPDNSDINQFTQCAKDKMAAQANCKQNLALLNLQNGFFGKIRRYPNVDLTNATVIAADHSSKYLMFGHAGQVIPLDSNANISSAPGYAAIISQYPKAELTAMAIDLPDFMTDHAKSFQLVFSQQLVNGCHACAKAGIAKVAYTFNNQGQYQGSKVLELQEPTTKSD